MEKVKNFQRNYLESEKFFSKFSYFDLKMEKVKNFQRNYLESEKFFSKFSYFLERENFQNLKVMGCYSSFILRIKSIPG